MNNKPEKLAARYTPAEIEGAVAIANDIIEGIDNGESRETLRKALEIYSALVIDARMSMVERYEECLLARLLSVIERIDDFDATEN